MLKFLVILAVCCIQATFCAGTFTDFYMLCFYSITEPSSEKHEEKVSNTISYTAKVKCKRWLEWDLNAVQARVCSISILLHNQPQRKMMRKFPTWFLARPKSTVKIDSNDTWTPSKRGSMCIVSILLNNQPQRKMKRKFPTWFLTLQKSSVKVDSSATLARLELAPSGLRSVALLYLV